MKKIKLTKVSTHNLKDINVSIPRDKLTVITGLSGSGKSSLVFDTIYAEGQRRYVESLSTYARQFLSLMDKPKAEHIEGLSPAISIEQKTTTHNPRSTVGTVTEIYDYLRVLFANIGEALCPSHKTPLRAQNISQMVDSILNIRNGAMTMIISPVLTNKKGRHIDIIKGLYARGYVHARIDGEMHELSEPPKLHRYKNHTIEVVIDRLRPSNKDRHRIAESLESALDLSSGIAKIMPIDSNGDQEEFIFSSKHACSYCGYSIKELSPKMFSFNSPFGACQDCDGLGNRSYFDINKVITNDKLSLSQGVLRGWSRRHGFYFAQLESLSKRFNFSINTPFNELTEEQKKLVLYGSKKIEIDINFNDIDGKRYRIQKPFEGVLVNLERRYRESNSVIIREELSKLMSNLPCSSCNGTRLSKNARSVFILGKNITELTTLPIIDGFKWINSLDLRGQKQKIAGGLIKTIVMRYKFLIDVGLGYLSLSRQASTLSGGEAQRIRLASQIGAGLVGVMYVLDEPSIGLHQRDNQKLLDTLKNLRDIGNTVIVVEHDEEAIKQADHIIDMGPGAGVHGGEVIAEGSLREILSNKRSLTADYLTKRKKINIRGKRVKPKKGQYIEIYGANGNNLQNIDLKVPLGLITCLTGVSGSGKSTLINQTLYPLAAKILNGNDSVIPKEHRKYRGFELLDKVIDINQSPIGRTPRSNPATYTGIFTCIRELFASTLESQARAYRPGRFSFNVKGGRCEACQGDGVMKVEMHFLPDVYVKCDSCQGKRYNRETLEIQYKGKNISDVLNMSIEESSLFFSAIPQIKRRLDTLIAVGLSYITLGQSATTFSGGEAQRIKLAKELSKRSTGRTLYTLDEPTTGLHFHDVQQLLNIVVLLRQQGNTIIIIEHNLDVVRVADWIIDLGPEGGKEGGRIVAEGEPESIAKNEYSYTGRFLKNVL